ncbi:MAG: hypothetical protein AAFU73_17055 [Planctomycetota bacterium]
MHALRTALVAAAFAASCSSSAPPPPLVSFESTALAGTVVVAHDAQPFPEGKGAIWAATSRLAWDAVPRRAADAPLEVGPPANAELVALMNREPFPKEALDPDAFVAIGGFEEPGRDGVVAEIRDAMRAKFGRAPRIPALLPDAPWHAIGYAFLAKDLPFEHRFERAERPMRFDGSERGVLSFHLPEDGPPEHRRRVREQVTVLFDRWVDAADGARDFEGALSIRTKGGADRVVLALVPRAGSLHETWEDVLAASAKATPRPLEYAARFQVPLAHFELGHSFRSLEGGSVDVGRPEPGVLTSFRQDLLFQMTESGVKLEAESVVTVAGLAAPPEGDPPPRFVFDRPFLLALVQEGATDPYLLWWVADEELLAAFED